MERHPPGKNLLAMTSKDPKNKVLALDDLIGKRTGKKRNYIRERTQLLQILHRQKEFVVALPLSDLKQPANAV